MSPTYFRIIILLFCAVSLRAQQSTFLWPTWGGTNLNQQRTPDATPLYVDTNNVHELEEQCSFTVEGSYTMYGFATIYRIGTQTNAVFTDFSGYVTNLNLDDCSINWRVYIQDVLQENEIYITRNGLSLFRLSDGTEGVIFGTPNGSGSPDTMKYVVALRLDSGELMWRVPLGNTAHEAAATVHAVIVDGDVAYANMASGTGAK